MRVAFLGPEGTFTEEALRASAPESVEEIPYPSVYETVMAVQTGEVDRAVVPIENSLEGSVTATLDALAGEASDVRIAAEVVHPVRHCLIARRQLALEEVRRVISHPQATAQCAEFLRASLPHAERAPATSTAEAVRAVAQSDEPWAALGSRLAAELYACSLLAEGVEDRSDNLTRFVWLARAGDAAPGRPSKTSIVFWGFNDQSPGALVRVLSELAERGVNLTKIESRPRRVRLGHYMFFADLEGGEADPRVAEALRALAARVETIRVLGSYPAAKGPDSAQ
jgi:prephenate dehydratase